MIYADSNLFIYSYMEGDLPAKCALFLKVNAANLATSFLTIDEVAWELSKSVGASEAAGLCEQLLSSRIGFLEVDANVSKTALAIMRQFRLKPRDAFHAATMRLHEIRKIASEDKDFDKIPGIKRVWF